MGTANSPTADVTIENSDISIDSQQQQTIDATADSSTATQLEGAKPKSTLDMVKEALQPEQTNKEATATASPTDAGQSNQADEGTDENPQVSEEEDKKLPFHNHPRWKEVIEENKALKQQAHEYETLKQNVEQLQERAGRFDVVADFVAQNGLEGAEIDTGFQVMAAIKSATAFGGDPNVALDVLMPIVAQLQALSGDSMPPDLQQKIDEGYIDTETAQEIARLRAQNHRTSQQAEVATQRVQQVSQQSQQQVQVQLQNQMISAVSSWESQWKTSDPDYAKKQPLVKSEVLALKAQYGEPRNAEEAINLANAARKAVDERLRSILPNKQEIKTVTGGNSKGNPVTKPKSTLDAVQQALTGTYKMQSPSSIGV